MEGKKMLITRVDELEEGMRAMIDLINGLLPAFTHIMEYVEKREVIQKILVKARAIKAKKRAKTDKDK